MASIIFITEFSDTLLDIPDVKIDKFDASTKKGFVITVISELKGTICKCCGKPIDKFSTILLSNRNCRKRWLTQFLVRSDKGKPCKSMGRKAIA